MAGKRALVTVLLTDAVSFSTKIREDEAGALAALEADFEIIRAVAKSKEGSVLKSTGDGLLVIFESAGLAVEAALEMQRSLTGRDEKHLVHRIGVHLSDIVLDEADAHGDGVNIASRLQELAAPGTVAVSKVTYDVIQSRIGTGVKFLGKKKLKGIPEPIDVVEISPQGLKRAHKAPAGLRNLALTMVSFGVLALVVGGLFYAYKTLEEKIATNKSTSKETVVYRDRPIYIKQNSAPPAAQSSGSGTPATPVPSISARTTPVLNAKPKVAENGATPQGRKSPQNTEVATKVTPPNPEDPPLVDTGESFTPLPNAGEEVAKAMESVREAMNMKERIELEAALKACDAILVRIGDTDLPGYDRLMTSVSEKKPGPNQGRLRQVVFVAGKEKVDALTESFEYGDYADLARVVREKAAGSEGTEGLIQRSLARHYERCRVYPLVVASNLSKYSANAPLKLGTSGAAAWLQAGDIHLKDATEKLHVIRVKTASPSLLILIGSEMLRGKLDDPEEFTKNFVAFVNEFPFRRVGQGGFQFQGMPGTLPTPPNMRTRPGREGVDPRPNKFKKNGNGSPEFDRGEKSSQSDQQVDPQSLPGANLTPQKQVEREDSRKLVGAARFELTTSCSQSTRATNCATPRYVV